MNVFKFFRRERGKESDMPEESGTQTATPPANSGGITTAELTAAIQAALAPVTKSITGLQSQIDSKISEAIAKIPQGITEESAKKLIADQLTAQQQATTASDERKTFIDGKLGKLPQVYQEKLGTDKAKWDEEAKAIQAQFESDFKSLGGKVEDVGVSNGGGTTAANTPVDFSKRDGFDLLASGLSKDKPVAREVAAASAAGNA